jgi:hypothetical protein
MSWEDGRHALELAMAPRKRRQHGHSGGRIAAVWILCLLIAIVLVVMAPRDPGRYLLLPVLILALAVALYRRGRLRYEWVRKQGAFAMVERWITEEGLQRNTDTGWTMTPWTEFSRIRVSDRAILLYTRSGLSYLVFPRALFASNEDWEDAVVFLKSRFPKG